MTGIIVQLALSWLIIWFSEKKDLGVLGLFPSKQRLIDFALFFIIAALCCVSGFFMKMIFAGQQWKLNADLSALLLLKGTWWNIKSVLFEELIFRGVLLYILIRRIGAVKAIFISAVFFGVYHWFSFEVFGNPGQMIMLFLVTGIMGLLYAYGYAKTFSLYIPLAIHLGWNVTQGVIFSESPIGNQLLVQVKPVPDVKLSYFIFLCILLLPMLSVLLINYFILKKRKQVELVI